MFQFKVKYEGNASILKCDYGCISNAETSTINTHTSQIYINNPGEDSVISLLNSYIELKLEVIKKADESTHVNCTDIRLVILGPIALFSNFELTTSSGKALRRY